MITWDRLLLIEVILFLIFLGPIYAWGLLHFFRYNFQWHLASIIGICTTVCLTAVMVWYPRGVLLSPEQVVYDLAIAFTSASPSMALVGWILDKDRKNQKRELNKARLLSSEYLKQLEYAQVRLGSQENERRLMMDEIKRLIEDNQRTDQEILHQALMLIGLRAEAEKLINRN